MDNNNNANTVNTLEPSQIKRPKKSKLLIIIIIILALIIGFVVGYFAREKSIDNANEKIAALEAQLEEERDLANSMKESVAASKLDPQNRATTTTSTYLMGIRIQTPEFFGRYDNNKVIIPLGSDSLYQVTSELLSFSKSEDTLILGSTDAIVYENYIKTGSQSITPNPNTLTQYKPLLVNRDNFCEKLGTSTKCQPLSSDPSIIEFQREYTNGSDTYTASGAIKFLSVTNNRIGDDPVAIIFRTTSKDDLIINSTVEMAKSIEDTY